MNFQKLLLLVGFILASVASTGAHADIPGNKGWHYVEIINNVNAKSILVNKLKCVNVNKNQRIKTNIIIVNGFEVHYTAYSASNCKGTVIRTNRNTPYFDNDPYWHLWY